MQRGTDSSKPLPAGAAAPRAKDAGAAAAPPAESAPAGSPPARLANPAQDGLSAWLAKYAPVEREIIEAHERRIASREKRREAAARAFGDLCEATEGLAVVWRREGWSVREMLRWADGDVLTLMALAKWLGRDAARFIDRAQSRLRRPLYYAQERARREALARERRRVGARRTLNPRPTREQVLDAWLHRRDSHDAAVRFGSMVHDLECYVDNSILRDANGAIAGRRGGVKAWLQMNIPALHVRYTTVMRYKAMAKKLRQATGLADPVPAAAVLAEPSPAPTARRESDKRDYGAYEITAGGETSCLPASGAARDARDGAEPAACGKDAAQGLAAMTEDTALAVVRARAVWLEVVDGVGKSATALMARLDALTRPERVEDANMLAEWKTKYENEIMVRMKSAGSMRTFRKRDVG